MLLYNGCVDYTPALTRPYKYKFSLESTVWQLRATSTVQNQEPIELHGCRRTERHEAKNHSKMLITPKSDFALMQAPIPVRLLVPIE
jgi:hypothetical protein